MPAANPTSDESTDDQSAMAEAIMPSPDSSTLSAEEAVDSQQVDQASEVEPSMVELTRDASAPLDLSDLNVALSELSPVASADGQSSDMAGGSVATNPLGNSCSGSVRHSDDHDDDLAISPEGSAALSPCCFAVRDSFEPPAAVAGDLAVPATSIQLMEMVMAEEVEPVGLREVSEAAAGSLIGSGDSNRSEAGHGCRVEVADTQPLSTTVWDGQKSEMSEDIDIAVSIILYTLSCTVFHNFSVLNLS